MILINENSVLRRLLSKKPTIYTLAPPATNFLIIRDLKFSISHISQKMLSIQIKSFKKVQVIESSLIKALRTDTLIVELMASNIKLIKISFTLVFIKIHIF